MPNPFSESISEAGGGRLVGRRKAEAAAAVESLLVNAAGVTAVSAEDLDAACKAVKLDSVRLIRKECKILYGRYLDYCFEDKVLSLEETADLAHLHKILQLSDSDVTSIQDEITITVYGRAVAEVLEDVRVDPDEADFLRRLREELTISETSANRIFEEGMREVRGRALREATVSDPTFVDRRDPAGNFTGHSKDGLQAAVDDALGKASLAIPKLQWFEISQINGYVTDGKASQWYVILQAGIERDDR